MRALFAVAIFLVTCVGIAAEHQIATLSDHQDDDFGGGALVYPDRSDFEKGDLDLRSLRISTDQNGFWFSATFQNPIRHPKHATTRVGPEPVSLDARRGFYAFNIDIYVDTDRVTGSGNTFSLPGRKVRIDSSYAWERAVVLTPRPELARAELLDVLSRQFPDRSQSETETSLDQSVFFPTNVRVRNKSIEFFVPKEFFAGSDGSDWAVVTLVTGAKSYSSIGGFLGSSILPLDQLDMGAMQPSAGRPADTFGYESAPTASPVVDALMPTVAQQIAALKGGIPMRGISWGRHAVDESKLGNTLNSVNGLSEGNGIRTPQSDDKSSRPTSVKAFLDPDMAVLGTPDANVSGQKPSVASRLKSLQQLYDQKLIDETELKAQKQRILNDL